MQQCVSLCNIVQLYATIIDFAQQKGVILRSNSDLTDQIEKSIIMAMKKQGA